MKSTVSLLPRKSGQLNLLVARTRPVNLHRPRSQPLRYATTTSSNDPPASRRKSVTVVNDTGAVPWKNLSVGEKAARTTQQTFNFGLVALGVLLTGGVATVLWLEVFSTDSKTAIFNRAADRVRADSKCQELLAGPGIHDKSEIRAFGEPSASRWARNRTIASRMDKDKTGLEHLHMHFYVEGSAAQGTVTLHMVRRPGEDFEYRTFILDVPGKTRHYLEDTSASLDSKRSGRLFGLRWT